MYVHTYLLLHVRVQQVGALQIILLLVGAKKACANAVLKSGCRAKGIRHMCVSMTTTCIHTYHITMYVAFKCYLCRPNLHIHTYLFTYKQVLVCARTIIMIEATTTKESSRFEETAATAAP